MSIPVCPLYWEPFWKTQALPSHCVCPECPTGVHHHLQTYTESVSHKEGLGTDQVLAKKTVDYVGTGQKYATYISLNHSMFKNSTVNPSFNSEWSAAPRLPKMFYLVPRKHTVSLAMCPLSCPLAPLLTLLLSRSGLSHSFWAHFSALRRPILDLLTHNAFKL
jgi:hypothetical protein